MTEINYVWIGSKKQPGDEKLGIDTIGADLCARQYPDQKVVFWCLESEKAAYEQHFQEVANISVKAIEPFVKEKEGQTSAYLQFFETLKRRAQQLKETPKHAATAVYEVISLKDSFFYWAAQYIAVNTAILDSTIVPDASKEANEVGLFLEPQGFSVPFIPGLGNSSPDPWLMLIKKDQTNESTRRFNKYFDKVRSLMSHLLDEDQLGTPRSTALHDEICNQFALCSQDAIPLEVEQKGKHARRVVGVTKTYLNSHRLIMKEPSCCWFFSQKSPWVKTRHWLFRYLLSDDLQSLNYFLRQGYFSPDQSLPYAESKTAEATKQLSLEQFTRRRLKELDRLIKQTKRKIETAKQIVHFEAWGNEQEFKASEAHLAYRWQEQLHSMPAYQKLGIDKIPTSTWQSNIQDIYFGRNSIERYKDEYMVRAKQYGMLLAHSVNSACLEKAASCAAPIPALASYLEYKLLHAKITEHVRFFNVLDKLSNFVLQRLGYNHVNLLSIDLTATVLSERYQTSWSQSYFKVIKAMFNLIIKNGLPSNANKAAYQATMYANLSGIRTFFNVCCKTDIQSAISTQIEKVITDPDATVSEQPFVPCRQ